MKNVPGRRTDWHECQWLQFLHAVGLLRAAFRPDGDVCAVRSLMRHRSGLVEMTSQHIQHMHKALTQMHVQIHHAISDITGLTGLAIVDAILNGQRDPVELAKLRDPHIRASEETIRKSLVGTWRPEHLFTLQQSRQMYPHYQEQIAACDAEIEKLLVAFQPRVDPAEKPLPPDRKKRRRRRQQQNTNPKTGFDLRTESYKLFGVDLTQIPGLMAMVLTLFSELGRDMSRWKTAGNFVSWLALCPDNDISGGRVLWRARRRVHNRAGGLIPHGGIFSASRPKPVGRLSAADEEQTRTGGGHGGDRSQDRHHLLHDGEEASGIRRNPVGATRHRTRRRTRETVRSETQTAGPATGLQTGAYRRKTCRITT
jgi:transposase